MKCSICNAEQDKEICDECQPAVDNLTNGKGEDDDE